MAEKRISTLSNTAMTRGKTTSEMLTKQQDNRIRLYQKVNSFIEYFQERIQNSSSFLIFSKAFSLYKLDLYTKLV